ncbi:MAG TPA: condensation domain-containing protein, partial [Candidatus Deferrimicrobium sp.]|nr:condensation domain-containing protein [Candidatus Deferrimicrobium sp.]
LLFNDKFQFDFTPNDAWTMFHSYCFDFSVWEMYGALLYGGKLLIVSKMMARDTMGFLGLLSREAVDVLNQTPSAFYNLINGVANARQEVPLFIKYIIFGGEALNPSKLKDWLKKYPQTRFINMFGITETTVHVTYKEINEPDAELSISNIGKPIPTLSVYILDRDLKPVPVGLMGEIFVGGDGVGRGYLNRVALTAEKFIKNPYRSGDRLYRSGDTGRFRENGDIEYLGRVDHQVKIRGFRIELGEIESELAKHNEIKDAVVISQQNETGENYLCAYIVPALEHRLSIPGLREYLGRRLPDYMLPAYFVYLERIPLNPNGKVDRGALPGPGLQSGENYTAPRDEIEKKLIVLWADILSGTAAQSLKLQTTTGIDDNFFQLGGHSLKAALLAARIDKAFNVKIPLAEIFKNPTVREFAKYIKDAVQSQYEQIASAEKKEYYVLSSAQKRLYFLQQMDTAGTAYNISSMMILDGVVDKNNLERSIRGLIRGHESLRTAFVAIGEEPVQRIYEQIPFAIEYNNPATDVPFSSIVQDFIRPFDLAKAPLLRVGLIKLAEEKHLFLVDMHHIISDGMSIRVLVQDFSVLYAGKELPPIKLHYKDYAEWQNREKVSKKLKEQEIFWQEEFA